MGHRLITGTKESQDIAHDHRAGEVCQHLLLLQETFPKPHLSPEICLGHFFPSPSAKGCRINGAQKDLVEREAF